VNDVVHPGEVAFADAVVRRPVDEQFPEWAGLPLERVGSSGTVNVLYELGDELIAACRGCAKVATRGRPARSNRDRE
jgi:hypothetical protein